MPKMLEPEQRLSEDIRIKVTAEMRRWVEICAQHENRTMNNFLRGILTREMRTMPLHKLEYNEDSASVLADQILP